MLEFFSQIDFGTYWGVFFFGIIIATVAMSTGIDGAAFWAPVLLLVYKVDVSVAIACAIFIELFGFGSGLIGYARRGKIMYKKALGLLLFSIPFAILGSFLAKIVPAFILLTILGVGAIFLVHTNWKRGKMKQQERCPRASNLLQKKLGGISTSLGGLFAGSIGLGLGETNNYYLINKNRFPSVYAAGTTVFMIAITDLFVSVFNALYFGKYSSITNFSQITSILFFAIPAVLIGAQVGVYLGHILSKRFFSYTVAGVLSVVSVLAFYRAALLVDFEQVEAFVLSSFS